MRVRTRSGLVLEGPSAELLLEELRRTAECAYAGLGVDLRTFARRLAASRRREGFRVLGETPDQLLEGLIDSGILERVPRA